MPQLLWSPKKLREVRESNKKREVRERKKNRKNPEEKKNNKESKVAGKSKCIPHP